jgi:hypothetical protein
MGNKAPSAPINPGPPYGYDPNQPYQYPPQGYPPQGYPPPGYEGGPPPNFNPPYGQQQHQQSGYYPQQQQKGSPQRQQSTHPSVRNLPPQQVLGATMAATDRSSIEEADEEEVDAIDILFQFIPYYGQGDTATDSMVRSTLSALTVEDIDQKDSFGNSLLLMACQYTLEDLVRIMISKGADPNATDSTGASCLHYPCYKETKNKNIAKLLLQNGANPEVSETTYGCTPLHYAAGTGDVDFCKLLLNYGAQVATYDFYNYTCVDYAREARMMEAASFLQKKLLQTASQASGLVSGSNPGSGLMFGRDEEISVPIAKTAYKSFTMINGIKGESFNEHDEIDVVNTEWSPHFDPATNGKYYMNEANGECLWEQDYLDMKATQKKATKSAKDILDDDLDDLGVTRVDDFDVFSDKELTPPPKKKMGAPSMDGVAMQHVLQEAKLQADGLLEKERAEHNVVLAEKDKKISKLESANAAYSREKNRLESEFADIKKRLEMATMSGGEAMKETQEMILKLETDNTQLKSELLKTKSDLDNELEKLKSLESTLGNLESGHAERIEKEREQAEERFLVQKQREQEHFVAIKEIETKMTETKAKLQEELSKTKMEIVRITRESEDRIEVYRAKRDKEVEEFNAEMSEKAAQFAVELSNAQSEADTNKKRYVTAEERAEFAEEQLKACQQEIAEAREVQQYNAQLHRDLAREQKARKRLHNEIEDMKGRIRVYVRVRPMSKSEKAKECSEAVLKDGKLSVLVKGLQGPDSKKNFDFDQVFAGSDNDGNSQKDVFKDTKHLMMSVLDGYNVCIFAYGQTGSGKTFTMIGAADIAECLRENGEFDDLAGITPRAVSELFRLLNERQAQVSYEVEVQMFQLYRDGLEDLLCKAKGNKKGSDPMKPGGNLKITLAEHSPTGLVNVDGANTMIATCPADVMKIFAEGSSRRATASTQMNAESSRSHLICSLVVKLTNRRTNTTAFGKLTLVDLAGSERVDKSGAVGEMLKEAQSINKSLSALGDVIASLTSGGNHTPYRNHPLTMLMSDSIGGNSKTLMFVNCSPADYNVSESNSSMQFASRCKDVTNATAAPPAVQAAQLNQLKKELAKLKKGGGAASKGGKLARPV